MITAVRGGSRLSRKPLLLSFTHSTDLLSLRIDLHLSKLLAETNLLPLVRPLHVTLLKFTTSILTASHSQSEMQQLWVGHGLRFLRRVWGADPAHTPNGNRDVELAALEFAIKVTGSLAELGWGGWKAVGMPLVMRMCVAEKVLELDGQGVLELLAALRRGKKLIAGDTDLVWRGKVEKWLLGKLSRWEVGVGGSAKVGFALLYHLSCRWANHIFRLEN